MGLYSEHWQSWTLKATNHWLNQILAAVQAAAGAAPAGPQESLLTASLKQKEQGSEIAESPFASMSQQSSGSSVDTLPDGTAKEDKKGKAILSSLTQLKIGVQLLFPHLLIFQQQLKEQELMCVGDSRS